MRPSPCQIAAFTQAARERSFSGAAESLGVTQSSITQDVANLERMMGTLLFIRRSDGLEMTRSGRELFEISDRLRTMEQLVEEKIASHGDLTAGNIAIVANAPRPVMPLIAEYARRYPQVRIGFSLLGWTRAMAQIRDRAVDVAVITEPETDDSFDVHELDRTAFRAYMRPEHPLAGRGAVGFEDLRDFPMILPEEGSFTRRILSEKTREHGPACSRTIDCLTFPAVREGVLHGLGIGLILEDSLFPSKDLVALPVHEMPECYRHCLVTPRDKRNLRLVESFVDIAVRA